MTCIEVAPPYRLHKTRKRRFVKLIEERSDESAENLLSWLLAVSCCSFFPFCSYSTTE